MCSCFCKRWAFNLQSNMDNEKFEQLYRHAIQCITPEDFNDVNRYVHKEDTLATLAGRLLNRQAAKQFTGRPWGEIEFARTERGKPYVAKPEGTSFGLNYSHQGDYTVFAGSCTSNVGIDVMRLVFSRGKKTADEYINTMAKSASPGELMNMRGQVTDQMKMTFFYRYWTLKEALLKATGQGILEDLSQIDFRVSPSDPYKFGKFLTSTHVNIDGGGQDKWVFEESFVDPSHVVSVCREAKVPSSCVLQGNPEQRLFFSRIELESLLKGATIMNPLSDDGIKAYQNFIAKPRKKF